MTLLTDHLPLLAGAPDGINKLRELIFDLAAQGRLLADSEDAGHTLLGEVADFVMGQAPPGSECNKVANGTVFVKTGEFGSVYPEVREWTTKPLKFAKTGDVLICVVGATVGKLNLGIECAIGRSVAAVRPKASLSTRYLYFALMPFTLRLRSQSRGSAQGVIGKAELSAVQLRMPSMAEQHRIVAKVDELMALCDTLEAQQANAESAHAQLVQALLDSLTRASDARDFAASWRRLSEHFDTLFTTEASIDALQQTVLQLAVMGKLVPQECVSSSLKGLPAGWKSQTIAEFCSVQGGIQKTPLRRPVSQHFPYLRVANVQRGRIDITHLERYELTLEELEKWRLEAGDILIVEGNGSESEIGRCAIWQGEVENCVFQNHLMRVRPESPEQVPYLTLYLNSSVGMAHMKRLAITTSGLFNLSVGKIRGIPVTLPPIPEQRRIVAKVEELTMLCDQLKTHIRQARDLNQELASTLVERAVA